MRIDKHHRTIAQSPRYREGLLCESTNIIAPSRSPLAIARGFYANRQTSIAPSRSPLAIARAFMRIDKHHRPMTRSPLAIARGFYWDTV